MSNAVFAVLSPWEPLHVESGFNQEDRAITLSFPQSYIQHWPFASVDEGILRSICVNLIRSQRLNLLLTHPHSRTLASKGWTQSDIKKVISEYARNPGDHVGTFGGIGGGIFKGKIPIRAMDSVAIMRTPNILKLLSPAVPAFSSVTSSRKALHRTKRLLK